MTELHDDARGAKNLSLPVWMRQSAAASATTTAGTTAGTTGTGRARTSATHGTTAVEPIHDPGFFGVVGRHFDFYPVTGDEPDEALAHFARDMGENEVTVFQLYPEHGAGENGVDGAFEFDSFFLLRHKELSEISGPEGGALGPARR